MKVLLCNEVLRSMPFARQCDYAAALGYDGLELAPFTLSADPTTITAEECATARRIARDAGVPIHGLHWLLVAPAGLSITTPDDGVRARTVGVMQSLIRLSADLGGTFLIHGSQRAVAPGETAGLARDRASDCFAAIARTSEECGQVYCIEPLGSDVTPVINTIAEAVDIVERIGSPALQTMLDINHAVKMENAPVTDVIDRWLPTGFIRHVHVNDSNRRGPGQGDSQFTPIIKALIRNGYDGPLSVEPSRYIPDESGSAARAIGYLRGVIEGVGLEGGA